MIRKLTGADDRIAPSGAAFPAFLVGIDQVNPSGNDDERVALTGNDDMYSRVSAEVAMKTIIAELGGPVWFSASWRYYSELDADQAIKDADLDTHSFYALSVVFSQGWTVTYTAGKLPLDVEDSRAWELGYSFNF